MRAETDCPADDRYVMLIGQYSANSTTATAVRVRDYLQQQCARFSTEDRIYTEQFLGRPIILTELVLQTCYCHADVPAGRRFDCAFDLSDPLRVEPTQAVIRCNVVWGRVVSSGLHEGWHQAAYIEFPAGVPGLVRALPVDLFKPKPLVGLCDSADWGSIADKLTRPQSRI